MCETQSGKLESTSFHICQIWSVFSFLQLTCACELWIFQLIVFGIIWNYPFYSLPENVLSLHLNLRTSLSFLNWDWQVFITGCQNIIFTFMAWRAEKSECGSEKLASIWLLQSVECRIKDKSLIHSDESGHRKNPGLHTPAIYAIVTFAKIATHHGYMWSLPPIISTSTFLWRFSEKRSQRNQGYSRTYNYKSNFHLAFNHECKTILPS